MLRRFTTEELMGRTFNLLRLDEPFVRKIGEGRNRRYWLCTCTCGNRVEIREDYLWQEKTHSCGCRHPRHKLGSESALWKGCGDLDGQYYSAIRAGAKQRGFAFNVTIEQVWQVFLDQDRRCAMTNVPLELKSHMAKRKGQKQTASLDRIDSTKPYEPGNIQWVHKDVNKMKRDFPPERFLEVCLQVAAHHVTSTSNVPRTVQ